MNVLLFMNRNDVQVITTTLANLIDKGLPANMDVLLYQTYPDEFNQGKFNPRLVEASDKLFRQFQGLKILACTHDNGDTDSFSRFSDSKMLPRVKCFPSKRFVREYNVVLLSSFNSPTGEQVFRDGFRDIKISCKFGGRKYHHKIRECVEEILREDFANQTDFSWVSDQELYLQQLKKTLITVGAPGWGAHNASYGGALKAGSLLFAHRAIEDYYLLPHTNLLDGEDYVSYDLYNFKAKLQRLLADPYEIERIRKNGRDTFKKGYNYKMSADKFSLYLKRKFK